MALSRCIEGLGLRCLAALDVSQAARLISHSTASCSKVGGKGGGGAGKSAKAKADDAPIPKASVTSAVVPASVTLPPGPEFPLQPAAQVAARCKYRPWDFTRHMVRKHTPRKRMGFLIQTLEEEQVQAVQQQRNLPDFKAGDILEVRVRVPEAQGKEYLYKGICIARYNKGIRTSFKLFNQYPDVGGVVQHLPLYMPDLLSIKVVGSTETRQRKLYRLLEEEGNKHQYQAGVIAASS